MRVTFKVQGASELESETNESASERNTLHHARSRSSKERETPHYEEESEEESARWMEREPRRINAKNVSPEPQVEGSAPTKGVEPLKRPQGAKLQKKLGLSSG